MALRMFKAAVMSALLVPSGALACDVALALTVDVSGSVDTREYRLQMDGLADALRDTTIADALVQTEARIMVIQWSGNSRQAITLPWHEITSIDQVRDLADQVASAPRMWRHYSTAIGSALMYTAAQFNDIADCKRKVIDVSGDGYSNEGEAPGNLRSILYQNGFTVNGLAIEGSDPDLTNYYWENVAIGEGAFVMTAENFYDYPPTIKQKLLRELTDQISLGELPTGSRG